MLVLARKAGETVIVDGPCVIKVLELKQGLVKIGIEADSQVSIIRGEIKGTHKDKPKKRKPTGPKPQIIGDEKRARQNRFNMGP